MGTNKQIALITGANSGIGNALARKLISENYFVIGTSRNGEIDSINSKELFTIPLDITSESSIENANHLVRNKIKKIDVLINNAGIGPDMNQAIPDVITLRSTFETNVFGLVNFTESILDLINEGGKIINISSIMSVLSRTSISGSPAYRMSKAALNMYTKLLSERLTDRNITVNSVHPGWVKTKITTTNAPLTPEDSANYIFLLLKQNLPTGTFWNAETQKEMSW